MTTLSEYLQTWRLNLSHTKTVTAAFHLNNREVKRDLKVYHCNSLTVLSSLYLSWGKTGQIAYISSPSSGIAQKTIFARHTAETTCRIRMGCWCQNTTHSCPTSGLLKLCHRLCSGILKDQLS